MRELIEEHAATDAATVAEFINRPRNNQGPIALNLACDYNHVKIVQLLVQHGANVNTIDHLGKSALHFAIRHLDNNEMVTFLIEKGGADIDLRYWKYGTPLHFAIQFRSMDFVLFLIESCGTNVEATDIDGWTALHHAVDIGNITLAQYLVKTANANVEAVDNLGHTPLLLSICSHNIAAFIFLKECGANIDATNTSGETIFCRAIRHTVKAAW